MPPTAQAGTSPVPYAYSALPLTVPLNGSASTPGSGASSITECVWELKSAPPGATASISSPTSLAGAALQTDRSGTHIVRLRVKNNLNQWSVGANAGDVNAGWPAAWETMPSSVIKIEVKEPNTGLVIKGEGEHGYIGKDYAWCKEVDRLRGQVNANTSGVAAGVVWIQAVAGDAEADGTPARPFNPTSAAAKTNPYTGLAFVGPWQQAQVALLDATLPDRRPRTIVALGGIYDEDVNISVEGALVDEEAFYDAAIPQWMVYANGVVSFETDRKFSFSVTTPAGDGIALAALTIAPYIGGLDTTGFVLANTDTNALGIGAAADAQAIVYLTNVTANVGVKTLLTSAGVTFRKCSGDVLLPSAGAMFDEHSAESVEVLAVRRADRSTLGDVTVSVSAGTGYYGCNIDSFTGPANSAKFDVHTAATFEASSGVFSGGAGKGDYLKIGGKLVANAGLEILAFGTMDIGADGPLLVTGQYINLSSFEGTVVVHSATRLIADAAEDVLIYSTGGTLINTIGEGDTEIRAVDGTVRLNSINEKIEMVAADEIQAKPGHIPGQTWNSAFVVDGQVLATIGDAAHGNKGRAVLCLVSEVVELPTESTSPETLWFWNIPANALAQHGSTIRGHVIAKTAANANADKTLRFKVGATAIATRESPTNDGFIRLDFEIVSEGDNEQLAHGEGKDSGGASDAPILVGLVAVDTAPITLSVEGETPTAIGDVILRRIYIECAFPPKAADVVFEG